MTLRLGDLLLALEPQSADGSRGSTLLGCCRVENIYHTGGSVAYVGVAAAAEKNAAATETACEPRAGGSFMRTGRLQVQCLQVATARGCLQQQEQVPGRFHVPSWF